MRRTGTLAFWSASCVCAMAMGLATAAEQAGSDAKSTLAGPPACEAVSAVPVGEVPADRAAPLPPNVEVRRVVVVAGAEGAVGEGAGVIETQCEHDPTAVYCNTLGRWATAAPGATPGLLVSDDIATIAVAGCNLDRYVIKVTGDRDGDGSGVGPYDVDVALYNACPSAGGRSIRGTAARHHFDDNGVYELEVLIDPDYDIPVPPNVYLGVFFSRLKAGIVVGAPATVGFSADSYDSGYFPCAAWLGGFPAYPHASFYSEIYFRPDCPNAFVGYKNTKHSGTPYSAGSDVPFADDIRLGVQECNMVAYEVAVKGNGRTRFHLRRRLEEVIPGTASEIIHSGLKIKRVEFDPPIPLPQSLYIVFQSSANSNGPIYTGQQAGVGSTADLIWVWDGAEFIPISESGYSAFDVSIWCAGVPPTGACCDMVLTEEPACRGGTNDGSPCTVADHCRGGVCVGESVCRVLPEMNCAFPALWEEGGRCGPVCVGGGNEGRQCVDDTDCAVFVCVDGPNDGLPCTSDTECPDGSCPVPICASLCDGGTNNGLPCTQPTDCPAGGVCPGFCDGGGNDGRLCTRQADCPGGECHGGTRPGQPCTFDEECPGTGGWCRQATCPGPARHPCGQSACCRPDGSCDNFTQNVCYDVPPLDDPRMFQRGMFCQEDVQRCPIPACLGREGQCQEARLAFCEGGDRDGELCDPDGVPWMECEGVCEGGPNQGRWCMTDLGCPDSLCTSDCAGVPGCRDPFCCSDVCQHLPRCCEFHWGADCAAAVWEYCEHLPANDRCRGATLVMVPSVTEGDGIRATEDSGDRFCCHADGPDGEVVGSVWYQFVATETSASLRTCCSVSRRCPDDFPASVDCGAVDSLIQVFSVGDPDRGICEDRLPCSISEQDCPEGDCVLDTQAACENLNPIACNDDSACSCHNNPERKRAMLCVTDLVPGQTYIVMVAGTVKWDPDVDEWVEYRGVYELELSAPCYLDEDPLHNDICENADQLAGDDVVVPFDLSGELFGETPATFDCPADCFLSDPPTMRNDVWYDWIPSSSGEARIETCEGDDTPNTTMVVYDGCDCPLPGGSWLGCSDVSPVPCWLGSIVRTDVIQDNCYKIRLGGWLGDTPSGNLSIYMDSTYTDCNRNGLSDACEIDCDATEPENCQDRPWCGTASADCNCNGVPDECDVGCPVCPEPTPQTSPDENGDGVPDECAVMGGGDLDGDGNVSLRDYALVHEWACLTGPCGSALCSPPLYDDECCAYADVDGDGDVDLEDVAAFQRVFGGP